MGKYARALLKRPAGAPDWVDELIRQLGKIDESVYRLMLNGLSFGENLQAELKDIEFYAPFPTWTAMTLAANWVAAAAWKSPAYRIDLLGHVWCRGLITNAAAPAGGTTITTFPTGYAPGSGHEAFSIATGTPGTGCIFVLGSGVMQYQSGAAAAGLALSTINFQSDSAPALAVPPTWTPGPPEIGTSLSKVAGILPVACRCVDATTNLLSGSPIIEWEQAPSGVVRIRNIEGLAAGRRYAMKLLLFAG